MPDKLNRTHFSTPKLPLMATSLLRPSSTLCCSIGSFVRCLSTFSPHLLNPRLVHVILQQRLQPLVPPRKQQYILRLYSTSPCMLRKVFKIFSRRRDLCPHELRQRANELRCCVVDAVGVRE